MKKIVCLLIMGLLYIPLAYAKEDTPTKLKQDLELFEKYIYHDIVSWEEEFQDFNQGIYQKILTPRKQLDETDIYIAKEFARVSQSLLRQIIKELNRIQFASEAWTFLNEQLITICYLQKYNLELLNHLPLSEEDSTLLETSRILVKDLQKKWQLSYLVLKERTSK